MYDDDRIYEWRRYVFLKLGYSRSVADYLAMTGIELEAMRRLVQNGCPLELAMEIMAGTNAMGMEEPLEAD